MIGLSQVLALIVAECLVGDSVKVSLPMFVHHVGVVYVVIFCLYQWWLGKKYR